MSMYCLFRRVTILRCKTKLVYISKNLGLIVLIFLFCIKDIFGYFI